MIVEKAVKMADMMDIKVIGAVENMSYVLCPDCGKKIEIYGKSGKKYEPGKGNDYVDDYGLMEEIEGNYMLVTLTADRKKMTEEFIIYFIDGDRNCLKALVVSLL